MNDFAVLKNLKKMSLGNPSNTADARNASVLATSSYVSSSTTQAITAGRRDSNLDSDVNRSDEKSKESFDYYNNAYQRYMAAHGGAVGGPGDSDWDDGFGRLGEDGDESPRDKGSYAATSFGESKHVGPYSPITSPTVYVLSIPCFRCTGIICPYT